MGYRSDVLMIIGAPKPQMGLFITRLTMKHPELTRHVLSEKDGFTRKPWAHGCEEWELLQLHECDIKWYDMYEDVKAFNLTFDLARSLHDRPSLAGLSGIFLRIGEDTDDIEEQQFGEPDVTAEWGTIERSISVAV